MCKHLIVDNFKSQGFLIMDHVVTLSLRTRVHITLETLYIYTCIHHSCCTFVRFTYEIAPVFVLMEQLTLKKMREMIGWPNGEGDGLFSPGETEGTIFKMGCAFCRASSAF